MTKESILPLITCFGEILWDNLPSGRMAGGAPMNVAYHLNRLGAESQMISRTGNDEAGKELIAFCNNIGLPTNLIQTDQTYPTGEVIGKVTDNHEVVYDILLGAAWDYITYQPDFEQLATRMDAFVFGSLASRNVVSRETLLQILNHTKFKVLDINLRAPHYSKEILSLLLGKADLLKLNNDELSLLADWFYKNGAPEKDMIGYLQQTYGINEIIVTKGGSGASFYTQEEVHHGVAYPVTVIDTVGAGDSFLAAFLYKKLTGAGIPETLDYALGMGAFIAGKAGACPSYERTDLHHFIQQHQPQD